MIPSKERFDSLCKEFDNNWHIQTHIGTYNEKRLHLILKKLVTDDVECHEVSVGNYKADVFCDGHITEIQTGSLYPLQKKLKDYLENTDYSITVIHPVIASKNIVRVDKDSGEILRQRRSPKKPKAGELFEEICYIGESAKSERLEIIVLYIAADEYRYSDEIVRYRKSGKYDSELFPRSLISFERYCGRESYKYLLDGCPTTFEAKEYAAIKGFSGRALYSTLNLLCKLGLLERSKKDKRRYEYRIVSK